MLFPRNYPSQEADHRLLSIHERTGASDIYTGRGVVIAFVDAGFYPHPDLGDRVIGHIDATSAKIIKGGQYGESAWYSWHGQMTSVIAAGDGRTSDGLYKGLAHEARLVLIKVSNIRRQIKEADILRGLRWLVENGVSYGVQVVNISVGGDFPTHDPTHPLHEAVEALTGLGMCVVVAAGNSGIALLVPPASAASAITVGGYDDSNSADSVTWMSYPNNYGVGYDGTSKPEVTASACYIAAPILPHSEMAREARWLAQLLLLPLDAHTDVDTIVRAAGGDLQLGRARFNPEARHAMLLARIHKHKLVDAAHQHVDGTSVSAAIASSVVAQMLHANPRLTPPLIKAILMQTARALSHIASSKQGAGAIDPLAAVHSALSLK